MTYQNDEIKQAIMQIQEFLRLIEISKSEDFSTIDYHYAYIGSNSYNKIFLPDGSEKSVVRRAAASLPLLQRPLSLRRGNLLQTAGRLTKVRPK